MVVMGLHLDLMILVVFSNLNASMILLLYIQTPCIAELLLPPNLKHTDNEVLFFLIA